MRSLGFDSGYEAALFRQRTAKLAHKRLEVL